MFVWSSRGGNTRTGCCGGIIFLPFAFFTMSAGSGDFGLWMLLLGLTVVAALFFMTRMMSVPEGAMEKRKNDASLDDEKPKRTLDDERYILTDDGEVLEIRDEPPRARRDDESLF